MNRFDCLYLLWSVLFSRMVHRYPAIFIFISTHIVVISSDPGLHVRHPPLPSSAHSTWASCMPPILLPWSWCKHVVSIQEFSQRYHTFSGGGTISLPLSTDKLRFHGKFLELILISWPAIEHESPPPNYFELNYVCDYGISKSQILKLQKFAVSNKYRPR